MAIPLLPHERLRVSRTYPTPEGLRLNVYAIQDRFNYPVQRFNWNQRKGWASLGRTTLSSVTMPWSRGTEETFLECEVRAAIRRKRLRKELLDKLPKARGEWVEDDYIFHTADGMVCFSIDYLKCKKKEVPWSTWYRWLDRSMPALGREVKAFVVPAPKGKAGYPERIVWVKPDVDAVVDHYKNEKTRKRPLARPGTWLKPDLWEDAEWGLSGTDNVLSEHFDRTPSTFGKRRRTKHPALKGITPDGRPRRTYVPKLSGRDVALVTCIADLQLIFDWERERDAQLLAQAPAGWETAKEIVQRLGIKSQEERMCLSFALKGFRQERPKAAVQVRHGENPKNRLLRSWHYDKVAFTAWLGGRTLKEAAAPYRRSGNATLQKRLVVAVRFLQFVLTKGPGRPAAGNPLSRNKFLRFAADPPAGPLQPRDEVAKRDILAWAKDAGVEPSKMLKRAKKAAGVSHRLRLLGRFGWTSYWYLPAPVVIGPATETKDRTVPTIGADHQTLPEHARSADNGRQADAVADQSETGDPLPPTSAKKKRRGRPPGRTPERLERERAMLEEWDTGRFKGSYAAAGEAHDIDRSDARKIIKAHEAKKAKKRR